MVSLDRLWRGVLAGMLAGLIMGIGARISMRIVALLGGMQSEFSLGGTLGILVLFTAVGVLFGAIFAGLRPLIPLEERRWGAIYGLAWAILVAVPFLRDPGGELALAAPWVGVALFAPLPLLGGLLLGIMIPVFDRGMFHQSQRTIHAGWLVALLFSVILAFLAMGPMMDSGARMPRAIWDFYSTLGVSFNEAREINGFLGFFWAIGYVGGLVMLFFMGGQTLTGRLAALGLLVFAAGFFRQWGIGGMADNLRIAALAGGVVKTAGVTGLLLLLHTFPNSSFVWRWSHPLVLATSVSALIWFTLPALGIQPSIWVPETLRLLVVAIVLGSGVVVLGVRLQRAGSARRQMILPSLGLIVAVLWFLGLWTASLIVPNLGFSGQTDPFAPLTVVVYLLPWLLPPLTLLYAVVRQKLWSVVEWENRPSQTIPSEPSNAFEEQYPERRVRYEEAH